MESEWWKGWSFEEESEVKGGGEGGGGEVGVFLDYQFF